MRIISRNRLKQFWLMHADSEPALKAWFFEAKHASWNSTHDIKKQYPSASIILDNRIVFNIKGNRYRLVVKINYNQQIVFIRFVGTHAEYNLIDATSI
jgi:mRNA interferase HigB